MHYLNNK